MTVICLSTELYGKTQKHPTVLIETVLTEVRTSFVQILQLLRCIFSEAPLWFDWESPWLSMQKTGVSCHLCSHFTEWSYRLCWGSSSHRSQASCFSSVQQTLNKQAVKCDCTEAVPVGFCDCQQVVTSTCTFRQLQIPRAQFEEAISKAWCTTTVQGHANVWGYVLESLQWLFCAEQHWEPLKAMLTENPRYRTRTSPAWPTPFHSLFALIRLWSGYQHLINLYFQIGVASESKSSTTEEFREQPVTAFQCIMPAQPCSSTVACTAATTPINTAIT